MSQSYIYIKDIYQMVSEIPADSIVSRNLYSDKQTTCILFAFAPGQELSEHATPKSATLYFVEGEAELSLGEERMAARPGTWIQMPPNLPHSIFANTRVLMLLTMISS